MNSVLRPVAVSMLCLGGLLAGCSESDRPLDSPVRLEGAIFGSYYQVSIADSLTQGRRSGSTRVWWTCWNKWMRPCRSTATTPS